MGWVVHRHGFLYALEYGWNWRFEALVARIAAEFVENFQPEKELCRIAELDGEIVGSVFLVHMDDTTAKLRLLYVEPKARGLGFGTRLVEECIEFGRKAGYQKISLWTNSILVDARKLYLKMGFNLMFSESYQDFGQELVSETWELDL